MESKMTTRKFRKLLKNKMFWSSEMGKGIQSTILIGLIFVSWYLLNSPVDAIYLGVKLSLAQALIFGSLVTIILAIISFFLMAIGEIKDLEPNKKRWIDEAYHSTYTSCLVIAIGSIVLQLYLFLTNSIIDFLLKKTKEWWQVFFLIIFLAGFLFVVYKLKIFPEKNGQDEKKS